MCLGIPGKVLDTYIANDMPMGRVDFGGIRKQVCLAHTPNVRSGQYVIVHVGFALQVIDEDEARQVFSFLERMNELGELRTDEMPVGSTGPPTIGTGLPQELTHEIPG